MKFISNFFKKQKINPKFFKIISNIDHKVSDQIILKEIENKLPIDQRYLYLEYLIENGHFLLAKEFAIKFNINPKEISIKKYMKGFEKSCAKIGNGISGKSALDFLYMYKYPKKFYFFLSRLGFLELVYFIKKKYEQELPKLKRKDMKLALKNFEKRNLKQGLFFQVNLNYQELLNMISLEPEKDLFEIRKILKHDSAQKDKDLDDFYNKIFLINKKRITNEFLLDIKEKIIPQLKNIFLPPIQIDINEKENVIFENIEKDLKTIFMDMAQKELVNTTYLIVILDPFKKFSKILILEEKQTFYIKNSKMEIEYFNKKEDYFNSVLKLNKKYFDYYLKNNQYPYTILIFKTPDTKRPTPINLDSSIEPINNLDYKGKYLDKVA